GKTLGFLKMVAIKLHKKALLSEDSFFLSAPSEGIQVNPVGEYLNYKITNIKKEDQWTYVSVQNILLTKAVIQPFCSIILRYISGSFNYQWYDTNGLISQLVTLLENGTYKFTWNINIPDTLNPTFNMQIWSKGGSLDIDIGVIHIILSKVDDKY
ncbi:8571_t:CDS:2, partial [Gigaspora rosea]